MPSSTASFIAYDVRPSKQIERRAIVEFLACCKSSGLDISSYRYVGFGGTKFVDFQLMKRYTGFNKFVSIERDKQLFNRCSFNRPFDSIEMFKGEFDEFLTIDTFDGNSMYWLDFEESLTPDIIASVNSAANRMKYGDILFTTIRGEFTKGFEKKNLKERKQLLKTRLPALSASIERHPQSHFTSKMFPEILGSLLLSALNSAFSNQYADGRFHPGLKVLYRDSMWMCTVGGVFLKLRSRTSGKLKAALNENLSHMCQKRQNFYRVPEFNFTELERILLDKSDISISKGYARRLLSLGLERKTLEQYQEISRFVPRYIESLF